MSALATDRNTPRREGEIFSYPVKAAVKIYGGSMVCVDANGYAVPASDTAGLKIKGVSEEMVDNSAGANADKNVQVRRGVFQFASSGLTIADIGKTVYVSDDQTVSKAATTNNVIAGVLVDIDGAAKAWVDNSRINPTHIVIAAGSFNTVGGDAAEAIAVTGMLATDIVVCQLKTEGAIPVTLDAAIAAAGQINVTMSADPAADHVISYMVLRAA